MGLSSKQVCGDGLDWSQIGGGGGSGSGLEIPRAAATNGQHPRPPPVRCPRCDSGNTKFCYYNNYSRLQPRHFCRACRRHWTEGGTLRNVPVGGGRKNKRPKTTTTTATAADADADADAAAVQLQVAGPFSNGGDSDSSIFVHDVFYPLLLNPPFVSSDQGGSSSSTRSAAMAASYDEAAVIDPLPHQSTTASAWLPPLPSSYCWNWWDDTMEFVAPAGFEHPATAGGP